MTTIVPAARKPPKGETKMNAAMVPIFDHPRMPRPPLAKPAPISPPTRACDELDGSPHHQVSRFQVMAPPSAPMITARSMAAGSTMPLPMVLATLGSKMAKARKLKAAAQTTAADGVRTRVETSVAIEFAASWKPLMKSKSSAAPTMAQTSRKWLCIQQTLRVLEHDALDHVGHVLAPVRGRLEELVDLLPLDDGDGVLLFPEQLRQRPPQKGVGLVLEPV